MDDSKDTLNNRYNLWDTRFLFGCACDLQIRVCVIWLLYKSLYDPWAECNFIIVDYVGQDRQELEARNTTFLVTPGLPQSKRLIVEWHGIHFVDDNHSFYFMFIR